MDSIAPYFQVRFQSAADPAAVVQVQLARFTVLTDRMIRIEYSPTGVFEDHPSQAFWYRQQPVPVYSVSQNAGWVRIETDALVLRYKEGQAFAEDTLWVEIKGLDGIWHFGDSDPGNLGGTARTLDQVDGSLPLGLGLISRSGWSLIDDSDNLVFNESCWLQPREAPSGQRDLYFLGYGHDYLACLRDFNRISGPVPMIPRWVLGNWWSRYWAYTQDELDQLVHDFQSNQVPLSVCIIDMDWHITDTGNDSTGWTGYSWNRDLFPNPDALLKTIREMGLKVALNLHPAEGIHRHESMYTEMAKAMGQDPASGEPVPFDITEPRFVDAYFRILHHPMEAAGIDFWWMDWQQGQKSKMSGLDPLWWLNHLHFYDLGRDGTRRSFIFSRWGGLGNHRYPIGFSGDTVVTWASLAFQPYFTATASNVNYGWWSHDIGGHMGGAEDPELYARWVQLGVFLPVLRLHATKNPYQDRRPWLYDAETFNVLRDALQLRHAMIPYLYSMAWRYYHENVPPLLPMYYAYPEQEAAYHCPDQYLFGDQLLVAPFITPMDPSTRLSRAVAWLPEGDWYDYFTGQRFAGDSWHSLYGTLRETPVFARAGAIVPQAPKSGWGGADTPEHLQISIFPGADGQFDLYDDEGNTNFYLNGAYAITPLRQTWHADRTQFVLGPAEGETGLAPAQRQYDLLFRGICQPGEVEVRLNGAVVVVETSYQDGALTVNGLTLGAADRLEVTLIAASGAGLERREDTRLATCYELLKHFYLENWTKAEMKERLPEIVQNPALLGRYLSVLTQAQQAALLETITGAGMHRTDSTGDPLVVVWNNHNDPNVTHSYALNRLHHMWHFRDRRPWSQGPLPHFQSIRLKEVIGDNPWYLRVEYYAVPGLGSEINNR